MERIAAIAPEEDFFVLSSLPPAGLQLGRIDAFVPAYMTAMLVADSITATLLFAQFSILRSRAILVIANGYLFTALILIPWILTFPGVFAPTGLIGGLQTTPWLYMVWHCGFPMFVIGYALSKDADPSKRFLQGTVPAAITLSIGLTAAVVLAAALFCIAGEALLPHIMLDPLRFNSQWQPRIKRRYLVQQDN